MLDVADMYRRKTKPDARPYTLVALLLSTGIKKGECLGLVPNHIDLEAPAGPLLFVRYASPQHRYKERKIALPAEWIKAYRCDRSTMSRNDLDAGRVFVTVQFQAALPIERIMVVLGMHEGGQVSLLSSGSGVA